MENFWVIALLIVVIPLFFWLRVKAYNLRKKSVSVRCPHCRKDQRLATLSNYTCKHCGQSVEFLDDDGTVKSTTAYYTCAACGEKNYIGVLTCTGCGLANPKGIPK